MAFTDLLLDTVNIYELTFGTTCYGIKEETETLLVSNWSCRFCSIGGGNDINTETAQTIQTRLKVIGEYNANIHENCILKEGDTEYMILSFYIADNNTTTHHIELMVEEIKR